MSQIILRTALALAALSLWPFTSPAFGQSVISAPGRPSATPEHTVPNSDGWVELALPSDYGGTGSVKSLGTSVVFRTSSAVHLWSAITAEWSVVPVSPNALVTQFNAYTIIEDGSTLHGFATRTGAVETLQLAGAPQLHSGSISSCWLSIAVLGNEAWSFAAFDGHWHHQVLASAAPSIQIAQTAGLVDDGVSHYGVSAYFGDFVPGLQPGPLASGVAGDVAATWSPSSAEGFSAHTNAWALQPLTNGVLVALERGYAMFQDGGKLAAFSGCTGDFQLHSPPAGFAFLAGRYVAAATAGNTVVAYSSGQNRFAAKVFQSSPLVLVDDEVLAVRDSAGVTAFSIVTGDFSAQVPGAFAVTTNDAMVWIDNGVQGHAFCIVTGAWTQAPVFGAQVQTSVLRNVVVLADAQGYRGFSGRTGEWVASPASTPFVYSASIASDLFAAFDGGATVVFDPILVRWAGVLGATPFQDEDLWRQTLVGFDGTRAYGYGLMNNVWSSTPIQGTYQMLDANSSCGFLETSTHLYTYSAHGTLSTLARFPEFSRLQPISSPLRLIQVAPAGSSVIAIIALHAAYIPFQPFGTLLIDPSSVIRRISLGSVPAGDLLDLSLDLSGMPSLQGQAVHIQNIVKPPVGPTYYTNLIAPVLL